MQILQQWIVKYDKGYTVLYKTINSKYFVILSMVLMEIEQEKAVNLIIETR